MVLCGSPTMRTILDLRSLDLCNDQIARGVTHCGHCILHPQADRWCLPPQLTSPWLPPSPKPVDHTPIETIVPLIDRGGAVVLRDVCSCVFVFPNTLWSQIHYDDPVQYYGIIDDRFFFNDWAVVTISIVIQIPTRRPINVWSIFFIRLCFFIPCVLWIT